MSNMEISVEFLAGTEIKEAITEAKEKARMLNVAYVIFNFNDRHISIGQNADISNAMKKWNEGSKSIIEA